MRTYGRNFKLMCAGADFVCLPGYAFYHKLSRPLNQICFLRALKSKKAEVCHNLIDIFCLFGAPAILQSDNGREFVNSIIDELKVMWPDLKLVHGKPRHSQSQGNKIKFCYFIITTAYVNSFLTFDRILLLESDNSQFIVIFVIRSMQSFSRFYPAHICVSEK